MSATTHDTGETTAHGTQGESAREDQTSSSRAFKSLEGLSFLHSAIYLGLLLVWITGFSAAAKNTLGWAHGVMWIVMSLLVIIAARKLIVSFRLAVLVVVIGGLGPFAGTLGFLLEGRKRQNGRAGDVSSDQSQTSSASLPSR